LGGGGKQKSFDVGKKKREGPEFAAGSGRKDLGKGQEDATKAHLREGEKEGGF